MKCNLNRAGKLSKALTHKMKKGDQKGRWTRQRDSHDGYVTVLVWRQLRDARETREVVSREVLIMRVHKSARYTKVYSIRPYTLAAEGRLL